MMYERVVLRHGIARQSLQTVIYTPAGKLYISLVKCKAPVGDSSFPSSCFQQLFKRVQVTAVVGYALLRPASVVLKNYTSS